MKIFKYSSTETDHLKSRDRVLGRAIDKIGHIKREVNPDLFSALVNAIVGQQISTKAQITIWERMKAGIGKITPEAVYTRSEAELQSYGISFRKASYIRGAAGMVLDGSLDIKGLRKKSDGEICRELVRIKGVGIWTAEMLMLFSMQRPDILSFGDLAVHRGMMTLYRKEEITPELFEKYRRRYTPYGSVASLYLWAVAGGAVQVV